MADPYKTLGVSPSASDAEIRSAYRRLVQLHHPDHNGGSEESERRFEEVQDAYAQVRRLRGGSAGGGSQRARTSGSAPPRPSGSAPPRTSGRSDPRADARLADLERQIREAQLRREQARRAAREAAAAARPERPSDEELGYIKTDDSFGKILADARDELADRLSGARDHPVAKRVSDLIDELEGLVDKLPGDRHD